MTLPLFPLSVSFSEGEREDRRGRELLLSRNIKNLLLIKETGYGYRCTADDDNDNDDDDADDDMMTSMTFAAVQ